MFLVFMLGIPLLSTAGHSQEPENQDQENKEPEKLVPEEFKDQIPYLSAVPAELAARSLGMTEIMGKPLDESEAQLRGLARQRGLNLLTDRRALQTAQVPSIGANVGIGTDPAAHENEHTVVATP